MPDHPKGYVKRGHGIQLPDEDEAERYRNAAQHEKFDLTDALQRLLIDEAQRACGFQSLRLHLVTTEPTHVHVLVSWKSDKSWERVRDGLKSSFSLAIRRFLKAHECVSNRPFFSHGSSRKRIRNRKHFDHWMNTYGPSHRGWKWREDKGMFK
jgi:REP element-mobilizing transposase RayT